MIRSRASELTGNFDKHLLVIGDVMLDRFVWGKVNRFSPEAVACPVLDFERETKMLGGAGNVATNLLALGAHTVSLAGLVGCDSEGREFEWLLKKAGVENWILRRDRPTTVKTRYLAEDKHLLRFDREATSSIGARDACAFIDRLRQTGNLDGIVLQDYAKGVITPSLVVNLMAIARRRDIPVFVDPKSEHWEHFSGVALIKPNLPEAMAAFGIFGKEHEKSVEVWGRSMLQYTGAKTIVITRGQDGMSLFTKDEEAWVLPQSVDVVDVSGAGDTSMATLALCHLAGASWIEALELANAAAGIAVGKRGTVTVTTDELLNQFPKEESDA